MGESSLHTELVGIMVKALGKNLPNGCFNREIAGNIAGKTGLR